MECLSLLQFSTLTDVDCSRISIDFQPQILNYQLEPQGPWCLFWHNFSDTAENNGPYLLKTWLTTLLTSILLEKRFVQFKFQFRVQALTVNQPVDQPHWFFFCLLFCEIHCLHIALELLVLPVTKPLSVSTVHSKNGS